MFQHYCDVTCCVSKFQLYSETLNLLLYYFHNRQILSVFLSLVAVYEMGYYYKNVGQIQVNASN